MKAGIVAGGSEFYVVVRTRSIFACVLHWVLFSSVTTLVITGLYISWPTFYFGQGEAYQAFAMADMRMYHFYAATAMIAALFTRMYLAFTKSCNKDIKQFLPTPRNIINALKLARFYLTFSGEHGHYRFINPLGGIGVFMMAICMLIMVITGAILYFPGANHEFFGWARYNQLELMLGGQQNVRLIHHFAMYCLLFFVTIHIYMQVWKNSMFAESDISSIIAGYKVFPEKLIGHFADYYGIRLDKKAPDKK